MRMKNVYSTRIKSTWHHDIAQKRGYMGCVRGARFIFSFHSILILHVSS